MITGAAHKVLPGARSLVLGAWVEFTPNIFLNSQGHEFVKTLEVLTCKSAEQSKMPKQIHLFYLADRSEDPDAVVS